MSPRKEALNIQPTPLTAVAIVPARLGSTRLPRKPLSRLGGAPLIVRVCENLAAADCFDAITVACDDEVVARVVREAGFACVLTEVDLPSGTDRVAACAKTFGISGDQIIVNVQGDEPFVSRGTLRTIVDQFAYVPTDAVVTAKEAIASEVELRDSNVVKVAAGNDDRALYFSRLPIPFLRDASVQFDARSGLHHRHVGIYAYRMATLQRLAVLPPHPLETAEQLEQLRWLANHYAIYAPTVERGHRGVDTPADLAAANEHFKTLHRA